MKRSGRHHLHHAGLSVLLGVGKGRGRGRRRRYAMMDATASRVACGHRGSARAASGAAMTRVRSRRFPSPPCPSRTENYPRTQPAKRVRCDRGVARSATPGTRPTPDLPQRFERSDARATSETRPRPTYFRTLSRRAPDDSLEFPPFKRGGRTSS